MEDTTPRAAGPDRSGAGQALRSAGVLAVGGVLIGASFLLTGWLLLVMLFDVDLGLPEGARIAIGSVIGGLIWHRAGKASGGLARRLEAPQPVLVGLGLMGLMGSVTLGAPLGPLGGLIALAALLAPFLVGLSGGRREAVAALRRLREARDTG